MMKCKEKRGFTAIEIAVVATIIAILSLLVIPLFRERSKQAKIAAAYDDMQSLGKAEQLAYAECNIYLRLQDIDNTNTYDPSGIPVMGYDVDLPIAAWNRPLENDERKTLARNWKGPYAAHNSSELVGFLYTPFSGMFSNSPVGPGSGLRGPVFFDGRDNPNDRYPVDPWKGPFIYHAEEETFINGSKVTLSNVIYCLGPNGIPGNTGVLTNADDFQRWEKYSLSPLGTGDDLEYRF